MASTLKRAPETTWAKFDALVEAGYEFVKDEDNVWHCRESKSKEVIASGRQKGAVTSKAWEELGGN